MGLRPAASAGFLRPWAAGVSLAGALALAWILLPAREKAPAAAPAGSQALGVVSLGQASIQAVPRPVEQARLGTAPQKPAAQGPQDNGTLAAVPEKKNEAALPGPAVQPAPSRPAVLAGSGQPLTRHESLAAADAPGPGTASGAGGDLTAAHSDGAKERRPLPYRLTVKGNRIRPALNESVKLELQVTQYGHVQACVYDSLGRFQRKLADLSDPSGPVSFDWDGRLADGQEVPSGAYTILIQSPDKTEKVGVLVVR
jgi:hypothetical protein